MTVVVRDWNITIPNDMLDTLCRALLPHFPDSPTASLLLNALTFGKPTAYVRHDVGKQIHYRKIWKEGSMAHQWLDSKPLKTDWI